MKQILLILSSPRGGQSYSHQVARHIVAELKSRQPEASVVVRDLARKALPQIDEAFVGDRALAADKRTLMQAAALATSDTLVRFASHQGFSGPPEP